MTITIKFGEYAQICAYGFWLITQLFLFNLDGIDTSSGDL